MGLDPHILILTPLERVTPLWQRLEQHYKDRLAELRLCNDAPFMDESKRHVLLGQIQEIKAFLALSQDDPHRPPR